MTYPYKDYDAGKWVTILFTHGAGIWSNIIIHLESCLPDKSPIFTLCFGLQLSKYLQLLMLQFLPQLVADLCLSVCQMVGVEQVVLWDFTMFIGWKHSCLLQLENELLKPERVSHNSQVSDQQNQNN